MSGEPLNAASLTREVIDAPKRTRSQNLLARPEVAIVLFDSQARCDGPAARTAAFRRHRRT